MYAPAMEVEADFAGHLDAVIVTQLLRSLTTCTLLLPRYGVLTRDSSRSSALRFGFKASCYA
jgi:hypothetical protein